MWVLLRYSANISNMIRLTRLNGDEFILNAELIRFVERCPDTLITLISGETLMVEETMEEVVKQTVEYQQSKYIIPKPDTDYLRNR